MTRVCRRPIVWLAACACLVAAGPARAADHQGHILFGGLPVPGATVIATRAGTEVVTTSDRDGIWRMVNLADGVWAIRVEMLGFAPLSAELRLPAGAPSTWELTLAPAIAIAKPVGSASVVAANPSGVADGNATDPVRGRATSNPSGDTAPAQPGFQRARVNASTATPPSAPSPSASADEASDVARFNAADGLLINGSVNNGAASPFAQLAAFGNNRPRGRSLYNGGLGVLLGTSAWDARPFSFAGVQTPKPSYADLQLAGTIGGPVKLPRVRNRPVVFLSYQRTADHNASTQSALMPTAAERAGDFSSSRDALGRSIQIHDPVTGVPFAGNVIPAARISPQAASLLGYYPRPNVDAAGRYNYQAPVVLATDQHAVLSRVTHSLTGRDQLFGNLAYQRASTEMANVFGFVDDNHRSSLDTAVNWSHRFSQFSLRLRYQYAAQALQVTPQFAGLVNVSGAAGIAGNNQDPVNWGPPDLLFSSGVAGFAGAQYARNHNRAHGLSAEAVRYKGRHDLTLGGGVHRQRFDVFSQQEARGTFAFTGAATGSDVADFLLGIPQTSSIAFGNADKQFAQSTYEAYLNDDWRVRPELTVNAGLRWEYEAPITEAFGRLVNLDVAPAFAAVAPLVAGANTVGPLTGQAYPASLMRPDWRGVEPRVGLAWRPVAGSSLTVRAGYGIYRNTSVYEPIALLLAQQPPLSKSARVENSAAHPLTLANGFTAVPSTALNTFAVDPDFKVGYAHNWQMSVQRDLPGSLSVVGAYAGSRGRRSMQEFLPNTYPIGAANPCPACPAGFAYLTSSGRSRRDAGQVQLRRRLRNGLSAAAQYTLAKATDDAPAMTAAGLDGAVIAQDWLDLAAERGPSRFDQRHLVTGEIQYTTGMGIAGGAMLGGLKGSLVKGWTFTGQLTTGSGLPLTPIYLAPVAGTGVTGTIRPDAIGAGTNLPDGYYIDPSAYALPTPGRWGTARRNSIAGPALFALNGGIGRSFLWGERINVDWRLDAVNILNRVTYAGVNAFVGSPQFGLPNRANPMRRIHSSLRVRF
jgi:hypothetical protein